MSTEIDMQFPLQGKGTTEQLHREAVLQCARVHYIEFLQYLFYFRSPGHLHWNAAEDLSEIDITNETPIRSEVLQRRPAIALTRSPAVMFHMGFNDDTETVDLQSGAVRRTVFLLGQMMINCVAKMPQESENIAAWVWEQLWAQRHLLIKRYGFYEVGRQLGLGSPSPAGSLVSADGAEEYFVTTISSPFQIIRSVQVTPLGVTIFKGATVNLRQRMATSRRPAVSASSAGGLPLQIIRSVPSSLKTAPPGLPGQRIFVRLLRDGPSTLDPQAGPVPQGRSERLSSELLSKLKI